MDMNHTRFQPSRDNDTACGLSRSVHKAETAAPLPKWGLLSEIGQVVVRLSREITRRRQSQRRAHAAMSLNEHLLRDIGADRRQIPHSNRISRVNPSARTGDAT